MSNWRALHYVFKIGDRGKSINFFKNILGMKVLRHEEFEAGCKATCNGPYDGKWSKTMIGYGPEVNHFVCELTYNYGVSHYEIGNDFRGMYIQSSGVLERAKNANFPLEKTSEGAILKSPDGYLFYIIDKPQPLGKDPVLKVVISVSNFDRSFSYWHGIAGLKDFWRNSVSASLGFSEDQAKLCIEEIDGNVNHAKAFGRIAFACPTSELKGIEDKMKNAGQTILTPLVSLDTPGKATVEVVILADPDGHEICIVGDEGFRELSQFDSKSDQLLSEAMANDKSDEWFAKKGGKSAA